MSLENVAPAANETVPVEKTETVPAVENTEAAEHNPDNDPDGNNEEPEAEGKSQEPEWAEIEIDGKKYKVEAAAKDGFLRQSDYTKKTQEVAEARRALEAEREGFTKQTEAQKAHFQTATKLAGLDEQLEAYKNVDWQTLYSTNPDLYQQHRINYDVLKDKRDAVARDYSQKEQERIQNEARENGTRVQKVQAEIARLIPEWTPGNEYDVKLTKYGTALGYSDKEMAETILRNPRFAYDLDRLRKFDEAEKKTKTQATFQKTQEAQPVTRVGGNSGAAVRRTTDSSGDALSTQEWVKREAARIAAKNKR